MDYDKGHIEVTDISYTVFAQDHFRDHSDDYMSEIYTMEKALDVANNFKKDFRFVYIRQETEYEFTR